MKLKLEIQEGLTILSILEKIDLPHIPILKAGLNKLIQSGKKIVVLDLTGIDDGGVQDPKVIAELAALPNLALDQQGLLGIASTVPGLGNAPTRAEAIAQLNSPINQLLAREAHLRTQLEKAQKQKAEADRRMSGLAPEAEVRRLRRENSDLRKLHGVLEAQVRDLLARRSEARDPAEAIQARIDAVNRTLTAVLEQEGILPVT